MLQDFPTIFLEGYFPKPCTCCIQFSCPCVLYICLFYLFALSPGTLYLLDFVPFCVQTVVVVVVVVVAGAGGD